MNRRGPRHATTWNDGLPWVALWSIVLLAGCVPRGAAPPREANRAAASREAGGTIRQSAEADQAALRIGIECLGSGQLEDAQRLLVEAAAARPDDVDVLRGLGQVYFRQGQHELALQHFDRACRDNPNSPEAANDLAFALLGVEDDHLRDISRALQLAVRACELTRFEEPEFLETLAAVHAELEAWPDAARIAGRALSIARSDGSQQLSGRLESALAHYRARNPYSPSSGGRRDVDVDDQVAQCADTLLSRRDGADHLVELAWRLATNPDPRLRDARSSLVLARRAHAVSSPRDARPWEVLAAAEAAVGNVEAAVAAARQARELASAAGTHEDAARIGRQIELYREGLTHWETTAKRGRVDDAAGDDRGRALAEAFYRYAAAPEQFGQTQLVTMLLRYALEFDPGHTPSAAALGRLLVEQRRHVESARLLSAFVDQFPGDVNLWESLGHAAFHLGDASGAAECYRRVLRARPESAKVINNLAWILATRPAAEGGDAVEAVRLAESLRESGLPAYEWLDTLAAAQAAGGQFEAAVATARRAFDSASATAAASATAGIRHRLLVYESGRPYLDADSNDAALPLPAAEAHVALANRLFRQDRFEEAVAHLRAALSHSPDDAKALEGLGMALRRKGRHIEALGILSRALRAGPDDVRGLINLAYLLACSANPRVSDVDEAVLLAELAYSIDAQNVRVLDTLGMAYAAAGRFAEAEAMAREALARAEEDAHEGAKKTIGRRLAKYARGEAHQEPAADESALTEHELATVAAELGALELQQGRPDRAKRSLAYALARAPENDVWQQWHRAAAEDDLDFHPTYVGWHRIWADQQAREGRLDRAAHHLQAVARVAPAADVYNQLGQLLWRQGRSDEALAAFQQAHQLSPASIEVANNLICALASRPSPTPQHGRRAVALARQVAGETDFNVPEVLDTLAIALAAVGDFDEAATHAQQALHLARATGHATLTAEIRARLQHFRTGRRWIDPLCVSAAR